METITLTNVSFYMVTLGNLQNAEPDDLTLNVVCFQSSRKSASNLQGNLLPSSLNKTHYFHMHIFISEFVIPFCYRTSGGSVCKQYIILFSNTYLIIKKTSTNHHTDQ